MANPQTNLRVRISAELGDIKSGLATLRKDLAAVKTQADRSLGNQNAFVSGLRRARTELAGIAATYLSIQGLGLLSGMADEAALLRGRVREAKGEYQAILDLAQRTRTGLSATVDLYARLERSTRQQGVNQQQLLTLTESVNKAVALSFTSTAAGEAALFQLGQGLGAGALRGEELNSVMEQTPRLAQAIADGLGVPIGKLRELAKEGKLTGETVTRALLSQAEVLSDEYTRIPVTISSAFTNIRNALLDYVGDQDEATGASRRFAETLQQIAADLPKYLDPVLKAVMLLLQNLDVLAVYMVARLAGAAIPAAITAFTALRGAVLATTTAVTGLRAGLALLGGPIGIAVAALAAGIYYLATRTTEAERAAKLHNEALEENEKLSRASAAAARDDAAAKRQQAIDTLKAARAALEEQRARLQAELAKPRSSFVSAKVGSSPELLGAGRRQKAAEEAVARAEKQLDDWTRRMVELAVEAGQAPEAAAAGAVAATTTATKAVRGMVDAAELAQDSIARALEELQRLLEAGEVGIAEYYSRRVALQQQAIDGQIAQAREDARTATTSEAQSKALTQIIRLERERAAVAVAGARDQAASSEEYSRQLGEIYTRLAQLDGNTVSIAIAGLEEEFREFFKRAEAEGDEFGKALARKLINREVARTQLDQFTAELQQITGNLGSTEGSLAAQSEAGLLGGVEAEQQVDAARTASLEKLLLLRDASASYLSTLDPESPEFGLALQGLQDIDTAIARVAASQDLLRQQVKDVATNAMTTFFTDLATGAKSAGEALKDFVRSFAQGMAQIAARAAATILVLQLMDALWPGSADVVVAGAKAGVLHAGGIAGAAGRSRQVSPLLFGAAPRYHSGGIAGLAPNEVPAILERGEEVLTKGDPRHRSNGGRGGMGGQNVTTTPVVVLGEEALADVLASSAGERMVVTHIRNNRQAIDG